jgi:hypothetical protein
MSVILPRGVRSVTPEDLHERHVRLEFAKLQRKVRDLGRPLTPSEALEVETATAKVRGILAQHMVRKLIDNRPEVISRGKPQAGDAAHRGLEEARRRLGENDRAKGCRSDCPAATVTRATGVGVLVDCAIEGTRLSTETDPQSTLTFCFGEYTACPSWQIEKEREAANLPSLAEGASAR